MTPLTRLVLYCICAGLAARTYPVAGAAASRQHQDEVKVEYAAGQKYSNIQKHHRRRRYEYSNAQGRARRPLLRRGSGSQDSWNIPAEWLDSSLSSGVSSSSYSQSGRKDEESYEFPLPESPWTMHVIVHAPQSPRSEAASRPVSSGSIVSSGGSSSSSGNRSKMSLTDSAYEMLDPYTKFNATDSTASDTDTAAPDTDAVADEYASRIYNFQYQEFLKQASAFLEHNKPASAWMTRPSWTFALPDDGQGSGGMVLRIQQEPPPSGVSGANGVGGGSTASAATGSIAASAGNAGTDVTGSTSASSNSGNGTGQSSFKSPIKAAKSFLGFLSKKMSLASPTSTSTPAATNETASSASGDDVSRAKSFLSLPSQPQPPPPPQQQQQPPAQQLPSPPAQSQQRPSPTTMSPRLRWRDIHMVLAGGLRAFGTYAALENLPVGEVIFGVFAEGESESGSGRSGTSRSSGSGRYSTTSKWGGSSSSGSTRGTGAGRDVLFWGVIKRTSDVGAAARASTQAPASNQVQTQR